MIHTCPTIEDILGFFFLLPESAHMNNLAGLVYFLVFQKMKGVLFLIEPKGNDRPK